MLSLYWLKHIGLKDTFSGREREAIRWFNLEQLLKVSKEVYLPGFEVYQALYEKIFNCLETRSFCSLFSRELPIELRKDLVVLFADKFIEFVNPVLKKDCRTIKGYKVKDLGAIKCITGKKRYVSVTSLRLTRPEQYEKFKFMVACYETVTELRNSLVLHNLDSYKKWAKHLFLVTQHI